MLCNGDTDGTLTVVVTGGTPDYSYLWSNGQTTATATSLAAGTYTVTVTDANGCTEIATGTVNEPAEALAITGITTELECNETVGGEIDVTATGGTAPYTYNWQDLPGNDNVADRTNLLAGTYFVTVTDANACTAETFFLIAPASALTASIVNDTICPASGAAGVLTVVPQPAGTYSYLWSDGQTTATATNLAPGTYSVTVSDAEAGCQFVASANVVADPEACGKIGNFVWYDADQDGIQDESELPVVGLVVELYTAGGQFVADDTTDDLGNYLFEGLAPGNYYITSDGLPVPAEGNPYTVTTANVGLDSLDSDILPTAISDIITLEAGECDLTWDIGFVRTATGGITDPCICQNDATTATDGRFGDVIEIIGIPGDVWRIVAQTGMFTLNSPAPPAVQTLVPIGTIIPQVEPGKFVYGFLHRDEIGYTVTVENLNGDQLMISNMCNYPTIEIVGLSDEFCLFDDLAPIAIDVSQFMGLPGTLRSYIVNVATNDTIEVDPTNIDPAALGVGAFEFIAVFTPDDPMECVSYRFEGFDISISDDCEPASIGDFVWLDENGNGIQNMDEPGVEGVTVNLKDAAGVVIATTTTNDQGGYLFGGLAPGTYSVQFVLPAGFEWTGANAGAVESLDSDADPTMNGMTETVTLVAGQSYLDLDAGIVPEVICELTATVTVAPVCNNNGTPTQPADDFYTVTVLVSGTSPSGTWRSNLADVNGNPIVGTVGVPFTFRLPVVQIGQNIEVVTITFSDRNDATCGATVEVTPTRPCSDQCRITASLTTSPYCFDNGTDGDPTDDVFFVGITANEVNAAGDSWTAYNRAGVAVGTGFYGAENDQIGPFTAADLDANGRLQITVRDDASFTCRVVLDFLVSPNVLECSERCIISLELVGDPYCFPNGTENDPRDDVWFVTVRVSGNSNVTRWVSDAPGVAGVNSFGLFTFGPFSDPINGSYTINVEDFDGTGDCSASLTVIAPGETCSEDCDIDGEILDIYCDDNGTPTFAGDDVFYIVATANRVGFNNSDEGWIVREGTTRTGPIVGVGPIFGNTYTFGPLPLYDAEGNLRTQTNFRIEDAATFYCRVDTLITLPAPCSNEECDLMIVIDEVICDDNGTPNNGADDTYDFTLMATGVSGGYTVEFLTPAGLPNARGVFGQMSRFGPIPANSNVSGRIIPDDPTCENVGAFFGQAPGPCTTCRLDVVELSNVCDDNGTADPGDDTFTVTLAIRSQEGGAGYMVDVPGLGMVIGLFNSADSVRTFTFPISGGDVNLIFRDMQQPTACFDEVTLVAPATCSPCDLAATLVRQTPCEQNGTPLDGSDDFFTVTVNVTGDNTGAGWIIAGTDLSGAYGEDVVLTFPTGTPNLVLTFVDAADANCTDVIEVTVPDNCPDTPICDLTATLTSGPVCNEDGTHTIVVTVSNPGLASLEGWVSNTGLTGGYGVPTTIVVEELCEALVIIFSDEDNVECSDTITVNPTAITIEAPADTDMVEGRDLICSDGDQIFGRESSLSLTGSATTAGCGVESVTFTDVYLSGGPGNDGADDCDDVVIERTFTATSCSGQTVTDIQLITVRKPLVTDVVFPTETIDFDCEGPAFPEDANGNPATSVTGLPTITTAFGDATTIDGSFCGTLRVAYRDSIEQTCSGTRTIFRIWTATDVCRNETLSGTQIIRTGDFSAPVVSCPISNHYCPVLEEDIMLFPMDPYDCVANFELPLPDVTDACSNSWTILSEVIDGSGTVVATIADGDGRNLTLGAGDYTIRYTVTDDCGNAGVTECIIRVADTQEPAAICISHINVSVGGYGIARIYSQMIDLGSYDNCGLDSILVRRLLHVDPITGDSLVTPIWTAWERYAEVDCNDAGSIVVLQLRVVDAAGNANICTTEASVVDNTLPYCTGLEDLVLSCRDLPLDFDPTDTLSLEAAFGKPVVIDNCAASSIELAPIVDIDECGGAGRIIRRWLAVDQIGNVSAQEFTQVITITADLAYTIVLPKDTLTECLDIDQGLEILGVGCADLSVSFRDSVVAVTPADGEACLVIERTYTIINNCTFDPAVDTLVRISRDEDCDGEEGESVFYAIVNPDFTYIDVDTAFTNAIPAAGTRGTECDGATNPAGYLRSVATTGGWIYTQRIAIVDRTRPTLVFEAEERFCATEEADCETTIRIPVTVTGECTAAGSNWLVLVDLGRDGAPEMRLPNAVAVQGSFPNYFIEAQLPIGSHNLMLRYIDGCNNSVAASIPFEIVDCSIPDPTCYSGLIANLTELARPVMTEDGQTVDVGVLIDAGRLASCDIEDCSGPLRFSVNRIGATPNVDSTTLLLTCDDRYTVDVEVYMWDSAFNPDAVQPDGSVGGPNWKMCVVEVLVQDPDELCSDCNADGTLNLGGEFTTANGVVLPGVEVELSGTALDFAYTDDAGKYVFSGLQAGDYTIEPYKADVASNGVSTLDELILQRHLLGIEEITDPVRFIAADLNGDGTLTIVDRTMMRAIVLGRDNVLADNVTWRFVPKAYLEAMGAELSRAAGAPQEIQLTNLTACALGHDFIGIKLGDLNGSVFVETSTGIILNGTRGRSANATQLLEIEELYLRGGERFELPVRMRDLQRMAGFQFTLEVDGAIANVEGVKPGLIGAERLGLHALNRGQVTANWLQPEVPTDGEAVLFTLQLRVLRSGRTSELFRLSDSPTFSEGYRREDRQLMNLSLAFPAQQTVPFVAGNEQAPDAAMELGPNFPNPFIDYTTISFRLPEAGRATLSLYDVNGKLVQTIVRDFAAGANTVKLNGDRFSAGTIIYTLDFQGEKRTRSMIKSGKR
ncbi:SdrD B-like domain-containing protein [Neolewinella lacunae]|uniref:SdrD B-like domain-containing protein n=1 Tax=Neolewinella lacunae TaxID=1517758 RepID=UPI0025B50BE4|nr:SdrD B-like domain-containing protein [Neolewinella lacunae]MDN3635333.1 SdrD B-like domain-containing protein [Neolewinella lacunae]